MTVEAVREFMKKNKAVSLLGLLILVQTCFLIYTFKRELYTLLPRF
jgi:hypothetical protein